MRSLYFTLGMSGTKQAEFKLSDTHTDGITKVTFAPDPNTRMLMSSSWDRSVRLYDIASSSHLKVSYTHAGAVLDCCFSDPSHAFSGGLDKSLKTFDFNSMMETPVGRHMDAIKCVEFCPELGVCATGSWDKTVKLWDTRQKHCIGTYDQSGEKVYSMSVCGERLIVATSNKKVLVWNLKNMQFAEQRRQSSLKFQTRCVCSFPTSDGFVLSSIEGRVAVEFLDVDQDVQKKKYAFKCHRLKEDGVEHIYPVTAISFHKIHKTFATGGGDGFVNIWDPFNKKRLCQFHRFPTDIASLAFNNEGTMIAVASSQILPLEGQEKQKDEIFVRSVSDSETQPK